MKFALLILLAASIAHGGETRKGRAPASVSEPETKPVFARTRPINQPSATMPTHCPMQAKRRPIDLHVGSIRFGGEVKNGVPHPTFSYSR